MVEPAPAELSFSRLSLFASCPLRYRYLVVERRPEPEVTPDWRRAPRAMPAAGVASAFDRSLGVVVHAGLARWQRAVDGGGRVAVAELLAAVRGEAERSGLEHERVEAGLARLEPGLSWYAGGAWPRRATLFLEHSVRHLLRAADGFAVSLHLRVDRVARFRRGVAILDFKTVSPHPAQLRSDRWQLLTYALALPDLLGLPATSAHLALIDLQSVAEIPVPAAPVDLAGASAELLDTARRAVAGDLDLKGHDDRPCWSCGFRLECPGSLAKTPSAGHG